MHSHSSSAVNQHSQLSEVAPGVISGCFTDASCRQQTEAFVQKGFYRWYRASVTDFLPLLVSAKTTRIQAVLGIRTDSANMMVTRYLDGDIGDTLQSLGFHGVEHSVAEIGNLYSESHIYTLPLLVSVVHALQLAGFRFALFTATTRVRALFMQYGLRATAICRALPDKIGSQAERWGSYYDAEPTVMMLDLTQVNQTIQLKPELANLALLGQRSVSRLCSQIRWLRHV